MRSVPLPDPDPVVAGAVRVMFAGKKPPLAVSARDHLGAWMSDDLFAAAFGARGRPGLPPVMLAMVTALQFAENLGDRDAADAVRTRLDWKYALGLPLDDPGFNFSVLSKFRTRVTGHGLEEKALDALLAGKASGLRWRRWPPHARTGSRPGSAPETGPGATVPGSIPGGCRPGRRNGTSSSSSTPGTGTRWSAPATRTPRP
jgi:hypothetical protein